MQLRYVNNEEEILGTLGDSFSKCKFDINGKLQKGEIWNISYQRRMKAEVE